MSVVLKHIASAAKGLSKAELHVLIELAARAEEAGENDAVASSRELAEATGLARSSVQIAVDSLNSKGLIRSDAGTATRSAMHRLLFLEAVEIRLGGPISRPGMARESGQCGSKSGPVVAQFPGHGGPTVRPVVARNSSPSSLKSEPGVGQLSGQGGLTSGPHPNAESSTSEPAHIENASAPAESIEKNDFDKLIDRIQNSKKGDFDDEVFEAARNLIASHHAKFAREGCQLPGKPDDQITAQFLAVADWPRLSRMLQDLLTERQQTSFSWGWYVTVALQRIHGISPERVRHIRSKTKNSWRDQVGGFEPAVSISRASQLGGCGPMARREPAHSRSAVDVELLKEQIRAVAAARSMR